jgi:teichuronic acid biosynthesis glycosyltransferase TuaC
MARPIRTLLFSTLYPSAARPVHGVFVETRLRELLRSGEVQTRVVAPVPWFPFTAERFGEYAQFARTPRHELRHGIEVHHPRYLLPPKVGMHIAPWLLALGAWPTVRRLLDEGFDFDLIDAHYYYPDGVAAGFIARRLGMPFVVTARGSDVNLISDHAGPRRLILRTAESAAASVGVCRALVDRLAELGADASKLRTLRNGVDLDRFRPEPQEEARRRLGLDAGVWLVSVGALIERKGHHLTIDALAALPGVRLALVGSGPERSALEARARAAGVSDRVRFVGQVPNDQLRWWYSAANASVLCSSREGWANVLLESMACGTPVVATDIWGTPEVVAAPQAGRLMRDRRADALVQALRALQSAMPSREQVRAYAERFSWHATSDAQLRLFREIVNAVPSRRAVAGDAGARPR